MFSDPWTQEGTVGSQWKHRSGAQCCARPRGRHSGDNKGEAELWELGA